jgi:hypothetical protein
MNSLPKAEDHVSGSAPEERPADAADPYVAFDELMVVVESLCPRWPEKEASRVTVGYLL